MRRVRCSAGSFPPDTGAANRLLLVGYLTRYGRMGALYADRAGSSSGRALDALDIERILALSPQAKGRVERLFGTLQDRLIKELRIRRRLNRERRLRWHDAPCCRRRRSPLPPPPAVTEP